MKLTALAALAIIPAMATPALAGPYVETKHEFKGTDEDFKGQVHQVRGGYDWKVGDLKPYVEAGPGVKWNDGANTGEDFIAFEVGSSVKITDQLSGYGKFENLFQNDDTTDWKVELGTKFRF